MGARSHGSHGHGSCRSFPTPRRTCCRLRLVVGGPELSMAKSAASCAWWDFDLPLLRKLSAELGIEVHRSEGLLQTLFRMGANVLAVDGDEEVMDLLGRRLALVSSKDYKAAQLHSEVDEAARCLTHEDEEVVAREQAAGKEHDNGLQSFVEEWRSKRGQVRQVAAKAVAKAGGRRAGRSGARALHPLRTCFQGLAPK